MGSRHVRHGIRINDTSVAAGNGKRFGAKPGHCRLTFQELVCIQILWDSIYDHTHLLLLGNFTTEKPFLVFCSWRFVDISCVQNRSIFSITNVYRRFFISKNVFEYSKFGPHRLCSSAFQLWALVSGWTQTCTDTMFFSEWAHACTPTVLKCHSAFTRRAATARLHGACMRTQGSMRGHSHTWVQLNWCWFVTAMQLVCHRSTAGLSPHMLWNRSLLLLLHAPVV